MELPTSPVALLGLLEDVFIQKRDAVTKLDAARLNALTIQEQEITEALRGAFDDEFEDPQMVEEALKRARWQASAFRMLVDDVLSTVSGSFGGASNSGTYDRRALRRRRYTASIP